MEVELLYWDGCPSYPAALADLRAALGEHVPVTVREVVSEGQAVAEDFPGSPTIRVDGHDVDPAGAGSRPALTCRIYHRPDGRVLPVPTREQIEEALG